MPCSGVKSLWTGALFFLAVTWLDRAALNVRWLLVAVVFAILLFGANLIRVGMLVVTADVLNMPLAAEMLHVPLGVLGFVGACAGAVGLLRWGNTKRTETVAVVDTLTFRTDIPSDDSRGLDCFGRQRTSPRNDKPLSLMLGIGLCAMGLLYAQRAETGLEQIAPVWNFPAALHTEPLPLKPDETEWLTR